MSGKGKNAIDMTGGSLWKNILVFSLPLMMTQMLEVLFNLSDVAIAGKYADYIALGAVGSTGAVYLGKVTVCKNAVSIKPPRYGY